MLGGVVGGVAPPPPLIAGGAPPAVAGPVAGGGLGVLGFGGGAPDTTSHVVLQDLIAIIGVYIGAVRIPEKWFPGQLDLVFNSHNIMHVLVVAETR